MILPDVNVLVYAYNRAEPHHDLCLRFLEGVVNGSERFGMSELVLSAVVRLITNPKVFKTPATPQRAFAFCDSIRSSANCVIISPGPRHWELFRQFCQDANVTGPDVTDAYYAALAVEADVEWVTTDRDFDRFKGLRVRNLLRP